MSSEVLLPKSETSSRPAASRCRAVLRFVGVLVLLLAVWEGSSCFVAYTDDAYLTSDLVSVAPEVTGPVSAVDVHDNQVMRRGERLFSIDRTPFELALRQAEAAVQETKAQLPVDAALLAAAMADQKAAVAALDLTTIDEQRARSLVRTADVPAQALDTAMSRRRQNEAQVQAAGATVLQAQQTQRLHESTIATAEAAAALDRWRLDRTEVVAPVDGPVSNLRLRAGDMATAHVPSLGVVDGHAWRIEANFKEDTLRHLAPGHPAWVWLDAMPWRFYRAHIEGVSHAVAREQVQPGVLPYVAPTVNWIRLDRRFPVHIQLDEPPPNMRLFMGSDARVLVFY